jgi:hypothetical protein
MSLLLTIELVPKTAWYSNVRSNVSSTVWDKIRREQYAIAGNKCEICNDAKGYLECHEIWQYNEETWVQKLIGLVALCTNCHKVKHAGLARIKGEEGVVIKQLMKVNKMSSQEAKNYIEGAFEVWRKRSSHIWMLDISYLKKVKK